MEKLCEDKREIEIPTYMTRTVLLDLDKYKCKFNYLPAEHSGWFIVRDESFARLLQYNYAEIFRVTFISCFTHTNDFLIWNWQHIL